MESFKEIQDSVCVSQRSQDGLEERVVLFLKMVPGVELSKDLITSMKTHIRTYLSARHVPAVFLTIDDIPVSEVNMIRMIMAMTEITQQTSDVCWENAWENLYILIFALGL